MGRIPYNRTFLLIIAAVVLGASSLSFSEKAEDKEAIQKVFKGLSDAWEQADGQAWGSYFTEEADFTVWFGMHLKGRQEIAGGHQWVFDSAYPNTRYEFEITNLKFLKPDIAIVHLNASIINPGESLPEDPHTFPVAVLQKKNDEWKIEMFHNMKNRIKEIEEGRKTGNMGDVRN